MTHICIHITDSLCCATETQHYKSTILQKKKKSCIEYEPLICLKGLFSGPGSRNTDVQIFECPIYLWICSEGHRHSAQEGFKCPCSKGQLRIQRLTDSLSSTHEPSVDEFAVRQSQRWRAQRGDFPSGEDLRSYNRDLEVTEGQ